MSGRTISRGCTAAVLALALGWAGADADAQENLSAFAKLADARQQPGGGADAASDAFGAVPGEHLSLVNFAPVLLNYFNNAPSYGIPGTVTGTIGERTQLSGDWGGRRRRLAEQGWFFDGYTTSVYQSLRSGGLATGDATVHSAQWSLNVDTGRAGWWSGGLLHLTAQSRYGDAPQRTFNAGASVPQYVGYVLPAPEASHNSYLSEYFLVQALSRRSSLVLGKISDIFIPDQTMFGDSHKYYFANFNLNKNAMTPGFYNPTALAALGVWAKSRNFAIAGGVLDPYSEPDNFAEDAFKHVNLYLMTLSSYEVGGLPGQFSPAFNWSNKPKTDLARPFVTLEPQQVPQALGYLLGLASDRGLSVNRRDESWMAIANVSQYLYVKDAAATIPARMRSGQVIDGIGVFARVGVAPQRTNTVTRDASLALFAHGLADARPYDSFGVGIYRNWISDELKTTFSTYLGRKIDDESGAEAFYDFALTPAVRLIASYQWIAHPLEAEVAYAQDHARIAMLRLNVAW